MVGKHSDIDLVETQFFHFAEERPFVFQSGESLSNAKLAYETHGELSPAKDNAILIFHALSGSHHVSGSTPTLPEANGLWTPECQTGWWDDFIGPNRAIDTNHFFVICANYIGGCYGSTGPRSMDPDTGKPYGRSFPMMSLTDIVETQMLLLDHLGIDRLHAVIGGSVGGMLSLLLATQHPDRVKYVIPIAASLTMSTLQRLLNFEQIYAIEEDTNFKGGDYYGGASPHKGLALARMIAHKSYISLSALERRARGEIVGREPDLHRYTLNHPVESYLIHQGQKFVQRFDANTYLRIAAAWQQYDLLRNGNATGFVELFEQCRNQEFLVFSIDSDVCFYPEEQAYMAEQLNSAGVACRYITVHSDKGHDTFLLEPELFAPHLDYLLKQRHL